MNKVLLIFLILISCTLSLNAVSQNNLVSWQFNEGHGTILLDSSGNSQTAVGLDTKYDDAVKVFGNYALKLDGNNDEFESIFDFDIPEILYVNFWVYKESNSNDRTLWTFKDDSREHFNLDCNQDTDQFKFRYLDENSITQTLIIPYTVSLNTWKMLGAKIDYNSNTLTLYEDKVIIHNSTLANTLYPADSSNRIKFGNNELSTTDFKGRIDSFNVYDFELNSSQLNTLFSSNTLDLFIDPSENGGNGGGSSETEINVTDIIMSDLITSYSPVEGGTSFPAVNFIETSSLPVTCDLYVDNTLVFSSNSNSLSFSSQQNLGLGNHSYFIYCEYIDTSTNIKYFDVTNMTTFEVISAPNGLILFSLSGTDFDINSENLYLVTPCLNPGFHIPLVNTKYDSQANPGGAYFQRLTNGQALFNLSQDRHQFCLINGYIDYDKNDYTTLYNPNQVLTQLEIGEFLVPNNLTTSYIISVENFDIYDKTNPKAWGASWVSIITSIIGIGLGLALIVIGSSLAMPQAVVMGALLVTVSLGFQIGNLVLGVLV